MADFLREQYALGFGQGSKHTLVNGTWTAETGKPAKIIHFVTECTPTVLDEINHSGDNIQTYTAGDRIYGLFTKITIGSGQVARIYY